jgi:hypothetical protein
MGPVDRAATTAIGFIMATQHKPPMRFNISTI